MISVDLKLKRRGLSHLLRDVLVGFAVALSWRGIGTTMASLSNVLYCRYSFDVKYYMVSMVKGAGGSSTWRRSK